MRKKQVESDFSWPFSKRRQTWISEGDRLSDGGDQTYNDCVFKKGEAMARGMKKSAAYYENAAEYYRRAGLGMMAQICLMDASECWSEIGNHDASRRCERLATEIDVYWEEESEEDDDDC